MSSFNTIINNNLKIIYSFKTYNDVVPALKSNRLHYIDTTNYTLKQYNIKSNEWIQNTIKNSLILPDIGFQTIETSTNQIFVIGGKKGSQLLSNILELVENKDSVFPRIVNNMTLPRMYHAVCLGQRHEIYISGGELDSGSTNQCEKYIFSSREIKSLPLLNEKRQFHSIIAHANYLFSIGGCCNESYVNTVEMLSISDQKKWFSIELIEGESLKKVQLQYPCVLKYGVDSILIMGGYMDEEKSECYVFTPGVEKLSRFGLALRSRSQFIRYSACEYNSRVFINNKNEVIILDIKRKRWINQDDIIMS